MREFPRHYHEFGAFLLKTEVTAAIRAGEVRINPSTALFIVELPCIILRQTTG
jgi:hypothetical protein